MEVSFHREGTGYEPGERRAHKKWICKYIELHKKDPGSITFIFTSNDYLRRINREYLQHNHFTDVITFDYSEGEVISGDIFISIDQVRENAGTYGVKFEEELKRVMIHGVLHLMGYKDRSVHERKIMRKMEDEALNLWEK